MFGELLLILLCLFLGAVAMGLFFMVLDAVFGGRPKFKMNLTLQEWDAFLDLGEETED